MKKTNFKSGFLMMELIVALAIFSLIISAATPLSLGGGAAGLDVDLNNKGVFDTITLLEDASASAVALWGSYLGGEVVENPYTKTKNVTFISPCAKLVEGYSSWSAEQNRPQFIGLETIVVNTASSSEIGGGCSATPPGDWGNPDVYSNTVVGLASGPEGTGVVVSRINGTRFAILTTADTGSPAESDVWIIDADDPANMFVLGEIDVGRGANGVVYANGYAYVIRADIKQQSNKNQLAVIDIASNPGSPSLVSELALPGVNPAGSYPDAISISYYNHRLYIGTAETSGPEFHVIDVTNPLNPSSLGSIEITHNINDIFAAPPYVYLATSDNSGELMVVNASDPSAMVHPDISGMKYNALSSGGSASSEDGTSIYVLGNIAYLGRANVNQSDEMEFYTLNISNPASISSLDSLNLSLNGANTLITSIFVQWPLAFLTTSDPNEEFSIWNVFDPSNIEPQGICNTVNYPQDAEDLFYDDGYLFVATRSNTALQVIYDVPGSCS